MHHFVADVCRLLDFQDNRLVPTPTPLCRDGVVDLDVVRCGLNIAGALASDLGAVRGRRLGPRSAAAEDDGLAVHVVVKVVLRVDTVDVLNACVTVLGRQIWR